MKLWALFFAAVLACSVLANGQINLGGQKHEKTEEEKEAERVPSIKGELKRLTKLLNLNEDQSIQVKSILEDEALHKRDLINNKMLPDEVKVDKFKKFHLTTTDPKINEILNDDQRKKFEEYDKKQMERLRSIG